MFSTDDASSSSEKSRNNGKAAGSAYETVPDWQQVGSFVAGLGVGALVGAALALLWAPGSGEETRGRIRRKFSRGGDESLWDSLGQELKRAAARRHPVDEEEIEELQDFEVEVLGDRD